MKNFRELAQELEKFFFTAEYKEKNQQFYNANQSQKTSKIDKKDIKEKKNLQKTYVRLAQILKRELFCQRIKRVKPIYKFWYQKKNEKPRFFLLDTYQKHRKSQLNQLPVGSINNFILNQGQTYQFFYGFG